LGMGVRVNDRSEEGNLWFRGSGLIVHGCTSREPQAAFLERHRNPLDRFS
jgi:hypothetical protein